MSEVVIKNIFIVRHGNASNEGQRDFDRPLKDKGQRNIEKTAQFIHKHCQKEHFKQLLCISSAAVRTQQTAEIIDSICSFDAIQYHQQLYTSSISTWLDKIINAIQQNIVIVGHNPTFSQMVNYFCGHQIYMKPANCALIQLEIKPDGIIYPADLIEFHNNE